MNPFLGMTLCLTKFDPPNSQESEFVSNMVRTAKYEYYNFLPMFLWEEFNPATKIANVYFLFIAALQASLYTQNGSKAPGVLEAFHQFTIRLLDRLVCTGNHTKRSPPPAMDAKPRSQQRACPRPQ